MKSYYRLDISQKRWVYIAVAFFLAKPAVFLGLFRVREIRI